MNLINLTPHEINIVGEDGSPVRTIEPSGTVARLSTTTETVGDIDGIPVTHTVFGPVENLPEPSEGVAYITSALVAEQVCGRDDVFVPASTVRDERGRIVGCKTLGRI